MSYQDAALLIAVACFFTLIGAAIGFYCAERSRHEIVDDLNDAICTLDNETARMMRHNERLENGK